jgi:hypothetical protein
METTGILKKKFDTTVVIDKFKKREFVLTTEADSQYPQQVMFQATQDRVTVLDKFNVGDELKVSFNIRGREWTNKDGEVKYFNTLEAWRIEAKSTEQRSSTQNNSASGNDSGAAVFTGNTGEDDLPF